MDLAEYHCLTNWGEYKSNWITPNQIIIVSFVSLVSTFYITLYHYHCLKVKVSGKGSCHRYGMIAVDDIEKGESLFEIPRSLLLTPETSSISEILETLANDGQFAQENRYMPMQSCYFHSFSRHSNGTVLALIIKTILIVGRFWFSYRLCLYLGIQGVFNFRIRCVSISMCKHSFCVTSSRYKHSNLRSPVCVNFS